MSDKPIPIGSFKIHVPVPTGGQRLLFQDGVEAGQHISQRLLESLVESRAKLIILIPDELDARSSAGEPLVMAEFFVGLLEPSLIFIRDNYFPDLEIARNRSLMTSVRSEGEEESLEDLVNYIFRGTEIYAEFERFIRDRILLGFSHEDDSHTLIKVSEEGFIQDVCGDKRLTRNAMGFFDKFDKALDCMYMCNMTCSERMAKEMPQQFPPATPS